MAPISVLRVLTICFVFGITSQSHIENSRRNRVGSQSGAKNNRLGRVLNGRTNVRNKNNKAPEFPVIHMDIDSLKPIPAFEVPSRNGKKKIARPNNRGPSQGIRRNTQLRDRNTQTRDQNTQPHERTTQPRERNTEPRDRNIGLRRVITQPTVTQSPIRNNNRQIDQRSNQNTVSQQDTQRITDQKVAQLLDLLIKDQLSNRNANGNGQALNKVNNGPQNNINAGIRMRPVINNNTPQQNNINNNIVLQPQNINTNSNNRMVQPFVNSNSNVQLNNFNSRVQQPNNLNNNVMVPQSRNTNNGFLQPNNNNNGMVQLGNINANVNNNRMVQQLQPVQFNNNNMAQPNLINNNRMVQPNINQNTGMIQPMNGNNNFQNSRMIQPNNVNNNFQNNNGMVRPNNINNFQNNGMVQPNIGNNNGLLQPSNSIQMGIPQPNMVMQSNRPTLNGFMQPNPVNSNLMMQQNNANTNGFLPSTNNNNNGLIQQNVNNRMSQPLPILNTNVQKGMVQPQNNGVQPQNIINTNGMMPQINTNNNFVQPVNNIMRKQPNTQNNGLMLPGIGNIMIRPASPPVQDNNQNNKNGVIQEPLNVGKSNIVQQPQARVNFNMMPQPLNTNVNPMQPQQFKNNIVSANNQMFNGQSNGLLNPSIPFPQQAPNIVTSPTNLIGGGSRLPLMLPNGAANGNTNLNRNNGIAGISKPVSGLVQNANNNKNENTGLLKRTPQIQVPSVSRNNAPNVQSAMDTQQSRLPNARIFNNLAQRMVPGISQQMGSPRQSSVITKTEQPIKKTQPFTFMKPMAANNTNIRNVFNTNAAQRLPLVQNQTDSKPQTTTIHLTIKRKKVIPSEHVSKSTIQSQIFNAISSARKTNFQNKNNGTLVHPQMLMRNGPVFQMPHFIRPTTPSIIQNLNTNKLLSASSSSSSSSSSHILSSAVKAPIVNNAVQTNQVQSSNAKRILVAAANANSLLDSIQQPAPKDLTGGNLEMVSRNAGSMKSSVAAAQQSPFSRMSSPNIPTVKRTNTQLTNSPLQIIGGNGHFVLGSIAKSSSDPKRLSLSFNLKNADGQHKTIQIVNTNSAEPPKTTVRPINTTLSFDNKTLPFNVTTSKKNGKMSITLMSKHTGGRPIVIEAPGNVVLSHVKGPSGQSQFIIKQATSTTTSASTTMVTEEVEVEAEDIITTTPMTTSTTFGSSTSSSTGTNTAPA